jgi:ADP-ribose pyrophosphatase YjhB (NUDIX family)
MRNADPCWYRVGVKAIIIKDDTVLLVKEGSDLWDFPGGGLEHDETMGGGLKREASEEIGVGLTAYGKLPVYIGKNYDPVNLRPVLVLYFVATLESENFTFGDSVADVEYVSINSLKASMFEPYVRPYFTELLNTIKLNGD